MSYHTLLGRRNHSYDPKYAKRNYDNLSSRANLKSYGHGLYSTTSPGYDSSIALSSPLDHRRSSNYALDKHSARPHSAHSAHNAQCYHKTHCYHNTHTAPNAHTAMAEKGRPSKRHRDLKRKMVFNLHEEINKPIHTFTLEEISDIGRITEICMDTLKSMMASRTHRKYLHHINNNNAAVVVTRTTTLLAHETRSRLPLDATNNQSESFQDNARKAESSFVEARQRLRRESRELEQLAMQEQRRLSQRGPRQRADTPIDLSHLTQETRERRKERQEEMIRMHKLRKRVPTDSVLQVSAGPSGIGGGSTGLQLTKEQLNKLRVHRAKIAEPFNRDHSEALAQQSEEHAPVAHLSISRHSTGSVIMSASSKTKVVPNIMSPVEALECKYLRLNEVRYLENMVRASGKHPGMHPHAKVDILEVFEDLHTAKIDPMKKVIWPLLGEDNDDDDDNEEENEADEEGGTDVEGIARKDSEAKDTPKS